MVFFFKQKTAYEMRISDWSSDVCSSDLGRSGRGGRAEGDPAGRAELREAPGAGHRQRQPGNPGAWRRSGPHQPAAAGTEGIAELTAKPPASEDERQRTWLRAAASAQGRGKGEGHVTPTQLVDRENGRAGGRGKVGTYG